MFSIRPRAVTVAVLAAAALAVPAGAGATTAPARGAAPAGVLPLLGQAHAPLTAARAAATAPVPVTAPLSPSQCQAQYGGPCYDAGHLRKVYGLAAMKNEGQGAVVALIMPYNNPVLRHDLDTYARQAGLPVPDLHISAVGRPVTADPGNFVQTAAVQEGELDAEMMLAVAPRVRLDYIETQEDFSLTPGAFSYFADILAKLPAQRPRVDAVSISLGYAEGNYAEEAGSVPAGNAVIRKQAAALNSAIRAGITLMASAGDSGSAGVNLAGTGVYPQPSVLFPASDPMVAGVSGTEVYAGDAGVRTRPDAVWSDDGDGGATGGGLSQVFARPSYQGPYAAITGNHRGVGDVSMDGATETPVWMYTSRYTLATDQALGWERVAGTSASSPLFAGIVALAAAVAGHPLGDIHQALYAMARRPAASGIQRVTSGCNTDYGIQGYCASPCPWSLPDGTGTVGDAARFVPALAAAASRR